MRVIAAVLIAFFSMAGYGAPAVRSYQVTSGNLKVTPDSAELSAFIQLDWSNPRRIVGVLCLPDGNVRHVVGTNAVPGQLELTFDSPVRLGSDWSVSSLPLKKRRGIVGNIPIVQWSHDAHPLWFTMNRVAAGANWTRFGDGFYYGDRAILKNPDGSESMLSLRIFDNMDREAFLDFQASHHFYFGDGGLWPGSVSVAFRHERLADITTWFRAQPDRLSFETEIPSATCGIDTVFADVSVPPLLEVWYARRMQTSRLFLGAYPIIEPAGSSMMFISTVDPTITGLFAEQKRSVAQRDQLVRAKIFAIIDEFVDQRRPGFTQKGRIEQMDTGQPFAYRTQLTGPALTTCDAGRWEKLLLQILLIHAGPNEIKMMLEFQEGFFAPGRQMPADARFSENRIENGALDSLASIIAGYFISQGFSVEDPMDRDYSKAVHFTCR